MNAIYISVRSLVLYILLPCIFVGNTYAQTVSAIPGTCSGANNQYTLTGTVTWASMPASGQMIISVVGEGTVIKNAPFASSVSYSIPGLSSDGTAKTVNVIFSASATTINQSYTAPAACIVNACSSGVSGSVTYNYTVPLQGTELLDAPTAIPKFNDMGGTRILQKVLITSKSTMMSNFVGENNAATATTAKINSTLDAYIMMGDFNTGSQIISTNTATNFGNIPFIARVIPPTSVNYSGDINGSTLEGLTAYSPNWIDALENFTDPHTATNWITALTGNPADDDDMVYLPGYNIYKTNSTLVTTSLSDYIGSSGNIPITVSTLTGTTISGDGGNLYVGMRTKTTNTINVTYYYCNTSILPISLLSVTGVSNSGCNFLQWSAAQAYNVNKFLVERSLDGISFTPAGEVMAVNTALQQKYMYNDCAAGNSDKWFYRIKILDNNGAFTYSSIIVIKQGKDGAKFSLYPNPTTDKIFINAANKINKLEIINAAGITQIVKTNFNLTEPILISSFAPGIYFIKAYTSEEILVSKFIKK